MNLSFPHLSSLYTVKKLTENDIPILYTLCKANTSYYQYKKMEPTYENLKEVFTILPPHTSPEDKYFLGFYQEGNLIAILDLCINYPKENTFYIGWFMIDKTLQNTGIGTQILKELFSYFSKENFQYVKLGCIKENQEAMRFWTKNGFYSIVSKTDLHCGDIICMQKKLIPSKCNSGISNQKL